MQEAYKEPDIAVTILTGFLGAGKTTLLNRILTEQHQHKIAIIENEFGAENIDNELLVVSEKEQIISMSNGCVCCTIRGDLSKVLTDLRLKRERKEIDFDYIVIETTGLANPGPIAQTFFMDDAIAPFFKLDGVVTVVDAKHAMQTLDKEAGARDQVGFADRVLLSKCDLVSDEDIAEVEARLRQINARAPFHRVCLGECPISEVLDISGFNISDVLDVDPSFFNDGHHHHHHQDDVRSFVFDSDEPFDPQRLERYIASLTSVYGENLLRYKGVLFMKGVEYKVIFQGVHMLAVADVLGPWADQKPHSKMVFIGRNLPEEAIKKGLLTCLAN